MNLIEAVNSGKRFKRENWQHYYDKIETRDILADDWELEPEWYDRIKDGVLCWVDNYKARGETYKNIAIIVKKIKNRGLKFQSIDGMLYRNAVPLTDDEIKKYSLEK